MNRRQTMYHTNKLAREWMLKNGFDQIWFKSHTRMKDTVYTQIGNYKATDLWNLFDGICLFKHGFYLVFFQVKTNSWANEKDYINFICKLHYEVRQHIIFLMINVSKKKGKWEVKTRSVKVD